MQQLYDDGGGDDANDNASDGRRLITNNPTILSFLGEEGGGFQMKGSFNPWRVDDVTHHQKALANQIEQEKILSILVGKKTGKKGTALGMQEGQIDKR